jgi:hypothetical protein
MKTTASGSAMTVAFLLLIGTAASAQSYDVKIPSFEFLDQGPHEIPYDQPIVVRIKGFDPVAHRGLRARFFRGDKSALPLTPHGEIPVKASQGTADKCFIYKTWEPEHIILRQNQIDVGRLPAIPKIKEHWVVVFEDGEWRHGLIKISRQAVNDYFQRGYEFIVGESSARGRTKHTLSDFLLGFFAVIMPAPHLMSDAEEEAATAAGMQEVEHALKTELVCVHFVHYKSPTNKEMLAVKTTPCEPCAPLTEVTASHGVSAPTGDGAGGPLDAPGASGRQ